MKAKRVTQTGFYIGDVIISPLAIEIGDSTAKCRVYATGGTVEFNTSDNYHLAVALGAWKNIPPAVEEFGGKKEQYEDNKRYN